MSVKLNREKIKSYNLRDVTPNLLWGIAELIVEKQKTALSLDPEKATSFMEETLKNNWFDYLEEALTIQNL